MKIVEEIRAEHPATFDALDEIAGKIAQTKRKIAKMTRAQICDCNHKAQFELTQLKADLARLEDARSILYQGLDDLFFAKIAEKKGGKK